MAKFFDQVKTLLSDVESFMYQVKDVKLSNKAKILKADILKQVEDIRRDKPQLSNDAPLSMSTPLPSVSDDVADESLYEDAEMKPAAGSDVNRQPLALELKRDIPTSDQTNLIHEGMLKFRKEKPGMFGKGKVNIVRSKQWCMIRGSIFYIYDKKSSKKQSEAFLLQGCQATPMDKESTKKETIFPFEIVSDNQTTYVFETNTEAEQTEWISALHRVTGIGARTRPMTASPDESIPEDDECLYEETDSFINSRPLIQSTERDSPPPGGDGPPPPLPNKPANDRPIPPVPVIQLTSTPSQRFHAPQCNSICDDIYDETAYPDEGSSPKTPANKSSLFSENLQRQSAVLDPYPPPNKQLPPPPVSARPSSEIPESPMDQYYAVWDCAGDNPKELSFSRGDIITVLSKQYEHTGWWVSKLQDRVGLVPKDYLTEAYERA